MASSLLKILIAAAIAYAVFFFVAEDGTYWHRFKLYRLLLTSSLDEIRDDYADQSCSRFSDSEREHGYFEAFVTGYCKPQPADFAERTDFLCAVALNCSCPSGKDPNGQCASSSFTWQRCADFDENEIDYCHQTASETEPVAGHMAADWSCFPKDSSVNIDGKDYRVTDKGSLIKGRRFDIWFDSCEDASKATGIYKVKL